MLVYTTKKSDAKASFYECFINGIKHYICKLNKHNQREMQYTEELKNF